MTIIKYIISTLGIIALYEILRYFIKTTFIKKQHRSIDYFIEKYNIKLDKYKFMNKLVVKQDLLNDSDINQAIIDHAEENRLKISDVKNEVEEYIEEIVPFFNILSYYKFGYRIAHFILNMIYEVVIDKENAEKLKKIPKDNVTVFVMNHRSNIDYIIVAYMLARNISLSYAVGEWARVWPLEYIFKSFGAYFIRRKFRKKIYHLVLEKYVQLISLQGVTQGIFIEGGLTRNGILREPKTGILDYIIRIKNNPKFKKDIVFIPVGINYDWVLEDRNLIREWKNKKEKTGFRENMSSLIRILLKAPYVLLVNFFKIITGKLKLHGYASVSFGDPVSVEDFLKKQKKGILKYDREKRLPIIKKFAEMLIERIGLIIPATPVCLTSHAILQIKSETIDRKELVNKVVALRKKLKSKNRRIVLGKAFERSQKSMDQLNREREDRKKELVNFEEELLGVGEAKNTVKAGLDILSQRKIVKVTGDTIMLIDKKIPYLQYYSNSLKSLF